MKEALKIAALTFTALVVLVALGFAARYVALQSNTFFQPKEEALRRDVVEQSKAYRDGVALDLQSLRLDYLRAPEEIKPAIAAAIRHRAVGVDYSALPPDLENFVRTLP
jgi:hypothetical protein